MHHVILGAKGLPIYYIPKKLKSFQVCWLSIFPELSPESLLLQVIMPVLNEIWCENNWWRTNATSAIVNWGIVNCKYLCIHDLNDIAVACFTFGPLVLNGNANGSTASTGSSCSLAKLPACKKTVGADLFTNTHANLHEVSYTNDSLLGSWALEKKYCVSPNVVSREGSIYLAESLYFWCWIIFGISAQTSFEIGLSLNSLYTLWQMDQLGWSMIFAIY